MGTAEERALVGVGGVLEASVLSSVLFPGTVISVSVSRGALLEGNIVGTSPSPFVNVFEVDSLGDLVRVSSP